MGKKLTVYTGPHWSRWNPTTALESGEGGAYMVLVDLLPRLVKRGWDVTVHADCQGLEGEFGGVEWRRYDDFTPHEPCDVLLAWRRPEALQHLSGRHKVGKVMFLAQDTDYGAALTPELGAHVNSFAVISDWHRRHWLERYPWCEGRVWTTRNGVDAARFRPERQGAQVLYNRALYTSAPYRGLSVALNAWPKVREQVPTAELRVLYGFEQAKAMFERRGDARMLERMGQLEERCRSTQGVSLLGRLGREAMDHWLTSAGVVFYPSRFDETSCIAAMEAQAAGCRLVTCARAALQETARFAYKMHPPRATAAEYAASVVKAMQEGGDEESGAARVEERAGTSAKAREAFDVDRLADEWAAKLEELTQ